MAAVAFGPKARHYVTGGVDRTLRVWRHGAKSALFRSKVHGRSIHAVAFDPKGASVASGCDDGFLRCYAVPSGEALGQARGKGKIYAVRYAGDGRSVFFGVERGVWRADVGTGKILEKRACETNVNDLQLSADGRSLLVGLLNSIVRIWPLDEKDATDAGEKSEPRPRDIRVGANGIGMLAVHPAGRLIAACNHAGNLFLVDIVTGRVVARTNKAHEAAINGVGFGRSNSKATNHDRLFSVGADARVKVWKLPVESSDRDN